MGGLMAATEATSKTLDIYYEQTSERYWLAPSGLSLREAKKQRVGRHHRNEERARLARMRAHGWR